MDKQKEKFLTYAYAQSLEFSLTKEDLKKLSLWFAPKKEIEEVKTKDTKKEEKELKTAKKQ